MSLLMISPPVIRPVEFGPFCSSLRGARRRSNPASRGHCFAFIAASARLGRSDQNADREHDGAAKNDLEHGLQERRVHVSRANVGDGPQLEEHDNACNGGPGPKTGWALVGDPIGDGGAETPHPPPQNPGQTPPPAAAAPPPRTTTAPRPRKTP